MDAHTSSLTHTHFDKYDSDADRVMTKDELAKLVHAQEGPDGPVTAARIDQWMSYYDLNNDGVVDPQEWAYRVREDRLQQLVANTDGDADGQVAPSPAAPLPRRRAPSATRLPLPPEDTIRYLPPLPPPTTR